MISRSRIWIGIVSLSHICTLALPLRAQKATDAGERIPVTATSGQADSAKAAPVPAAPVRAAAVPAAYALEVSVSAASPSPTPDNIYREIDDLHTGDRWLLLRDRDNPAGPGRIVLAGKVASAPESASGSGHDSNLEANLEAKQGLPVIHRGDSLIVIEESATVSEQLEAVALEPAAQGALFQLRLKLGGRTYRAVAIGPGRARFDAKIGAQ